MATETTKIPFVEGAAAATPAASRVVVYAKADGLMYSKDDAGTETLMSGGAGGGSVATDTIWDAAADTVVGTGANTAVRRKNNDSATVAPTVNEDSGDGYAIGSRWLDTTADKEYVATDVTVGAAVWKETTSAGVSVAVLQDQKAQNTAGGTFTSGAWQTRVLNTEVSDPSSIVALASNQFTPIAGTYLIKATAPAYAVVVHQARLQNVTAATTTQLGTSMYASNPDSVNNASVIDGVFTANGTDAYEIQHQCSSTTATNGFGVAANFATEVYTSVVLIKIA